MNLEQVKRFNGLYQRHLRLLSLQGKSQKTIDAYSRAIRRIRDYFDCCPDQLTTEKLKTYFQNWWTPIPGAPSRSIEMPCKFFGGMCSSGILVNSFALQRLPFFVS